MIQNNILYIGGYGRSGSTVLEKILSSHPNIIAGGEIFRMGEIFSDDKAMCTCGKMLKDCPVWGPVRIAAAKEAVQFGGFPELHSALMRVDGRIDNKNPLESEDMKAWLRLNGIAFNSLRNANPNAKWIVDSSKTARGAALRPTRLLGQGANIRFINLRRSVSSVLQSISKGTNREIEGNKFIKPNATVRSQKQFRAYVGWVMANTLADELTHSLNGRAIYMRYENLTTDPDRQLGLLFRWLGLSCPNDWENLMKDTKRHMIGGNRTRFKTESIQRSELPTNKDILGEIGLKAGRRLAKLRVI